MLVKLHHIVYYRSFFHSCQQKLDVVFIMKVLTLDVSYSNVVCDFGAITIHLH